VTWARERGVSLGEVMGRSGWGKGEDVPRMPALLMRMSSRVEAARKVVAARLMLAMSVRSSSRKETWASGLAARISFMAASYLDCERAVMYNLQGL
jgi:hypothetical protein